MTGPRRIVFNVESIGPRVGGRPDTVGPKTVDLGAIGPELDLSYPAQETDTDMPIKTKTQRDPRREELRKLGERVREHRRTRNMTQEALAEALDLSVAYVSLIERGGRNPPYTTVVAIARALGVPAARIVAEE
jgi:DNA-binding XRE family transcriptional regulator